jgi:hypothetical protein
MVTSAGFLQVDMVEILAAVTHREVMVTSVDFLREAMETLAVVTHQAGMEISEEALDMNLVVMETSEEVQEAMTLAADMDRQADTVSKVFRPGAMVVLVAASLSAVILMAVTALDTLEAQ